MSRTWWLSLALMACSEGPLDKPAGAGGADAPGSDDPADRGGDDRNDDASLDSDGDGLTDAEELELGTDPHSADTDGDGWNDGEEVWGHTDPLDASDHPYAGGWPIDACRHDIVATGNGLGQVAQDFALTDQYGETLRLHDFCGKTVVLLASAMWCGACQSEAPRFANLHQQYAEDGLLVITLLAENVYGQTPSVAELSAWAEAFQIDHPVVADPGFWVGASFVTGNTIALPSMSMLGPGGVVLARDSWLSNQDVLNALP